MDVKIIEDKKQKFVVELEVDKGLCHALKKELWNDDKVTLASVYVSHPLTGNPKMIIETKDKNARDAFKKAIDRLEKKASEFKKEVSDKLK